MRKLLLLLMFSSNVTNLCAQADKEAFAKNIFRIFKNDLQSELPSYRLSKNEVSKFLVDSNIDIASQQIEKYIAKYPAISKALYQKCEEIQNDSTLYPVWGDAELTDMQFTKYGVLGNPNSESEDSNHLNITLIIFSKEIRYSMFFEALKYNERWLLGNSMSCFKDTNETFDQ